MDKQQSILYKKYIDLFSRWKIVLLILFLISLPVGLLLYLKQPKIYQAESLLSYQQQRINPNEMSPDVQDQIQDIVSTLSKIVTSRTNLETLITNFDLYSDQIESTPTWEVVNEMREDIRITPSKRGDTFTISFIGNDPEKVVLVTNSLAAKFIEENLKYREERATETSTYTSDELEMAKVTMDSMESAMRDYKLKYYNELPDQREANIGRLIALQEQYQDRQESIQELERTRVMVQEQIAVRKQLLASEAEAARLAMADASRNERGGNVTVQGTELDRLLQMRAQLESLSLKYTDKHPQIRQLKKAIARIEENMSEGAEDTVASAVERKQRLVNRSASRDEDILQLQTQINDIGRAITAIEQERENLKEEINKYEAWVAAAPIREAEWAALTREYGELKRHYDELVSQDLQAKSMLNLERKQKGSQFKIEDQARIPEEPIEPNFIKTMAMSVGGFMAAGVALVMAVSFIDGSFRDPDEMESYLGLPITSTINFVEIKREKNIRILKSVFASSVVVGLFAVTVVIFGYAWNRGMIII